ncbi:MAG: flippase [Anaerolineae bacterium]
MNTRISALYQNWIETLHLGLRSTMARNAASLYLIQFANYIVPLIMVPYLVRVLGPAGYGAVAFAQGFINYLMLFVEYGFDWSATRKISVYRESLKIVNETALHVWAAKGLLTLLGFVVLVALVALVPKLNEVKWLLMALYGLVLGNALFPTWLFQGMERMVAISIINLAMKVAALVGVFLLIRRPEDTLIYAGLMGGEAIVAGLTGMVVAARMFRLKIARISWKGIRETLREGWVLFLSKASVSLYTVGNAFILGILASHTAVGYYSAAEKIVKSILGLLGPVAQAAYPRLSKLAAESREQTLMWGRRMLMGMGGMGLLLTLGVLWGAPLISSILLGPKFEPSIAIMRILAPIIFLIAMSNVLGIQIMLPLGKDRAFTLILFTAGILNISLALLFAPTWQALGMGIAVLISELFVTATMYFYLQLQGVTLFAIRKTKA